MFPVPKELIEKIENSKMNTYRDFDSEIEKSRYIDLLNKQIVTRGHSCPRRK